MSEEYQSPIEKPKRTATPAQLAALEKARIQRKINAEKKKQQPEPEPEPEEFSYPSSYLIATAVLGLGGLAGYYWLKQQKNSQDYQKSLETTLTEKIAHLQAEITAAMPKMPRIIKQDPQIIEKHTEVVREVEKPVEAAPVLSASQQKELDYFSGARRI